MDILIPRYMAENRPYGIIPPSPPAERREERRRIIERELRYPISGRVLLPGMPAYNETMQAAGLVNGGMVNEGHALVDGGVIRAHTAGLAITAPDVFYRFEEASGNRADSADSATLDTFTGTPGSTTGKIGNCITFNGSQRASRTSLSVLSPSGVNFSLWGWFWPSSISSFSYWVMKGAGFGTINYALILADSGDNKWEFRKNFTGFTDTSVKSLTNAIVTTWQFVAIRYTYNATATSRSIAISLNDGGYNALTGVNMANGDDGGAFCVGADINNAVPANGRVDALAFWNGHLITDAETTTGYNGVAGSGAGTEFYSGLWH